MDAHTNPAVERRERLTRENPPPTIIEPKPMQRMSAGAVHSRDSFKPTERLDLDDIAEYAREHPTKEAL